MKELARKIRNTHGYENLEEIMGCGLGEMIYKLVNDASKCETVEEGYAQGVTYACARIVDMYDQPTIAMEILKESGVDVVNAHEYDVAFLRKQNKSLAIGK